MLSNNYVNNASLVRCSYMVEFRVMIRISADELKRKNRGDKMVQRISNLPDGCNRLDEPWSRDHINGPDYEEIIGLTEPITKEEFEFFFEDEIEEQNQREMEFDNLVKNHSFNNNGDNMNVMIQNIPHIPSEDEIEYCFHGLNMETCIGCGQCKTVLSWTPEGALSGKPTILRTLEETRDLERMERAQSWKSFSKETHQLINDMRFVRQSAIETKSREISIDFDKKDYAIGCEILFGREAPGIDEPTIIDDLFF